MDLVFRQRNNGCIQHSHPDQQAGTLLRASQPIFFSGLFSSLRTGARCRLAHGLASSGREACPNTYRHPEGAHIHIAEPQLGSAPTVFSSSARDPADRIPLNIVAAAAAGATSPAKSFISVLRFFKRSPYRDPRFAADSRSAVIGRLAPFDAGRDCWAARCAGILLALCHSKMAAYARQRRQASERRSSSRVVRAPAMLRRIGSAAEKASGSRSARIARYCAVDLSIPGISHSCRNHASLSVRPSNLICPSQTARANALMVSAFACGRPALAKFATARLSGVGKR